MVAGAAVAVDAGFVVAGPDVDEMLLRVVEQVPDDHQDGPADRDDRPLAAPPAGDPSVPLTEEGARPTGADRGLTQCPGEVPVAVSGAAVALLPAGGFRDTGREPGPRRQVRRGWGTCSCPGRSCDTRSHILSEFMDRRSDDVGHVTPGECSMPVPRSGVRRRSCLLGCEARGVSLRAPVPSGGATRRGGRPGG